MEENLMEYEECYIAFMDLLGFKNRIEKKTCEEILKIYDKMKVPWKRVIFNDDFLCNEGIIKAKVMSDSICFYVDVKEINGLYGLIMACMLFQIKLANFDEPIFVRGAVVKGKIYAKEDVMFGPGLTKAYLLEEKSAIVPRIIMLKQVADEMKVFFGEQQLSVEENVLVEDRDGFYIINYFDFLDKLGVEGDKERLINYVEMQLATEYDSNIREKYRYVKNKLNS